MQHEVANWIARKMGTSPSHAKQWVTLQVQCTQKVFLVFHSKSKYPIYAAKIGRYETLAHSWQTMNRLAENVTDIIPKPVCFDAWNQEWWMLVSSGLPGDPWFGVSSKLERSQYQDRYLALAIETLNDLHAATFQTSRWRKVICPETVFADRIERVHESRIGLSENTINQLYGHASRLNSLGSIDCHPQHGDFCINNLIYGPDRVYVIDFDEFGQTQMPLHDQMGLAVSFSELAPGVELTPELIKQTATSSRYPDLPTDCLLPLLLHYLLYSLEQTISIPGRQKRQGTLLDLVCRYAQTF